MQMICYMVDTYHGPMVLAQRATDWIIASPYRSVEIYDGRIPASCLEAARPISESEARELVLDLPDRLPGAPLLELGASAPPPGASTGASG
jgi:hypothetical protein